MEARWRPTFRMKKFVCKKAKQIIPKNKQTAITASIMYDETSLVTPNNESELVTHTITEGESFYIPYEVMVVHHFEPRHQQLMHQVYNPVLRLLPQEYLPSTEQIQLCFLV